MTDKFDPTKPCTTRDGRAVVIYCTDAPGLWPIHGRIQDHSEPRSWHANGRYWSAGETCFDLINVPQPKRVWYFNVYEDKCAIGGYLTRASADKLAAPGRIACVRVEEGQYDE